MSALERPIFEVWPALHRRLPLVGLLAGVTPVDDLSALCTELAGRGGGALWVKRDDLTAPAYGGNKVRTLEVLFGEARARGATHIYSVGAYGSNHAVATILHGEAAGLAASALLYPQPPSGAALDNLRVSLSCAATPVRPLASLVRLPWVTYRLRRAHRARGEHAVVMPPGGATPLGALGYVSAALELAQQVARGELPAPRTLVVGVGSTCTSAGLLVGLAHAARLGIGFTVAPTVRAVQVAPWPVTSPIRIARLAQQAAALLAELSGRPDAALSYRQLRAGLEVDARRLGWGYGAPTPDGLDAIARFAARGVTLDTTYSAKAASSVIDALRGGAREPLLFWATKSSAPLPDVSPAPAPAPIDAWLRHCAELGVGGGADDLLPPPPSALMKVEVTRRALLIYRALFGASPY